MRQGRDSCKRDPLPSRVCDVSTQGWYSVRDEAFYTEDELVDGKAPTGVRARAEILHSRELKRGCISG
eukprot:6198388-Pleurochrysis_carterae.AAC.2